MALDRLLVDSSIWVWQLLDSAERAGFSPREETLTEYLLVEMQRRAPEQVRLWKATGREEQKLGIDFAWALEVRPSLWLRLLVQAKKLNSRSGRYEELARAGAQSQARRLLTEAQRSGSVALHTLYNGSSLTRQGEQIRFGGCTRRALQREAAGPPWRANPRCEGGCTPAGCTVVATERVLDLVDAKQADRPEPLLLHSAPWECLLCPFLGAAGRPEALPWPDDFTPDNPLEAELPWLTPEPPEWATILLEGGSPEEDRRSPPARHFFALRSLE